jgi:SAM-dependent methyltransferase
MDEQARETAEAYDRVAEAYREEHGDRSVVSDQVALFLAALDGERVLDVGCGPGWESAAFAEFGACVAGVDLSQRFLLMASEAVPDAEFSRMDMRRLGHSPGSFDGIWACASVHHVPRTDIDSVFAECSVRPASCR